PNIFLLESRTLGTIGIVIAPQSGAIIEQHSWKMSKLFIKISYLFKRITSILNNLFSKWSF
ncbi:hypothetical protein, partial [Lysinibacillus fusiformis]|uniref:hypothetical protein n=1 Tax=Lysinibacillus fusiformis TaxID=28031 RepID=UPI00215ADDC2